jgi:hypothetical protein
MHRVLQALERDLEGLADFALNNAERDELARLFELLEGMAGWRERYASSPASEERSPPKDTLGTRKPLLRMVGS